MKSYAYVMLNGVNGTVIRCHHDRYAGTSADSLNGLLALGYVPLREVLFSNNTVLLILSGEAPTRGNGRKRRPARLR